MYIKSGSYNDRVGVISQVIENAYLVQLNDGGLVAIPKENCILIADVDSKRAEEPSRSVPSHDSFGPNLIPPI